MIIQSRLDAGYSPRFGQTFLSGPDNRHMKLGVIMDPIQGIKVKKDSTLAMMLAAQRRGWTLRYMELNDLLVRDAEPLARTRAVSVKDDPDRWFDLSDERLHPLSELDVILMRKDPPVDTEYIYVTHLLELAAARGVTVINDPVSLRDVNEKLFINQFPQCIPSTLVTRSAEAIRAFVEEHDEVVLKPLHGMGGMMIFRVGKNEHNFPVIVESLTQMETRFIMAQKFVPDIYKGDKRILMIDGKPVPYALARIPRAGDFRGNLAAGGRGEGMELSERDRWICDQVAPELKKRRLTFAGLDVIGDYLTEINVTSPTCIRELDAIYGIDIAGQLMDVIARRKADATAE